MFTCFKRGQTCVPESARCGAQSEPWPQGPPGDAKAPFLVQLPLLRAVANVRGLPDGGARVASDRRHGALRQGPWTKAPAAGRPLPPDRPQAPAPPNAPPVETRSPSLTGSPLTTWWSTPASFSSTRIRISMARARRPPRLRRRRLPRHFRQHCRDHHAHRHLRSVGRRVQVPRQTSELQHEVAVPA